MPPRKPESRQRPSIEVEQKFANKTFFRFVFSFIAVIAGVLLFILVLGVGSGV